MVRLCLALLLAGQAPGPSFIYQDPAADQAIRRAMHATYSLDLVEARKTARTLQKSLPDHPAGFLLDAETYWWEAQQDPDNKKIEEAYYQAQELAAKKAEAAAKSAGA